MGAIVETDFLPGEILFREGENSFHFYILHEGTVEVLKTSGDKETVLGEISPGHSVGEFAMISRAPRSATARAVTPVRASMISEEAYTVLLGELPDWAVVVMQAMVDRIHTLSSQKIP